MSRADWQRFRKLTLSVPELSLLVDLSKTSLADDALASDPLVSTRFPDVFAAMAKLEKGAIANPDENRRVGHYWLRAPELAPDEATTKEIKETLAWIRQFTVDIHSARLRPPAAPAFKKSSSSASAARRSARSSSPMRSDAPRTE